MNSLFGYALESDFPLFRQRPAPADRGVLAVRRAVGPIEREGEVISWHEDRGSSLEVMSTGDDLLMLCSATGVFRLSAAQRCITADPAGAPDWWEHRFGSVALPMLLGELGDLPLHAAALDIGDRALIICGQSGAGKSTLAATVALAGLTVLSEDGVVVSGLPGAATVWPGLDGIRVDPGAYAQIPGASHPTRPREEPDRSGKPLFLARGIPVRELPAVAIAFLEPRGGGAPVIERIEPTRALPALVNHGLSLGRARLPLNVRRCAALLERMPAYLVALPDSLLALPRHASRVIDVIREETRPPR